MPTARWVALLIPLTVQLRDLELARLGDGPRKDYFELAAKLDGEIVDIARITAEGPVSVRLLYRVFGPALAIAWWAFLHRHVYSSFYAESERVGLPLAALLKLPVAANHHVMIAHWLSPAKKRLLLKYLRLHTQIDWIVCHSDAQQGVARLAGVPAKKVVVVPYGVDHRFWHPLPVAEEDVVCAVGMERRDDPTLVEAVRDSPRHIVIAAASPWFAQAGFQHTDPLPPWIETDRFAYPQLRQLYARSRFVIVPLLDLDFQAGITTVLEAMAMGKAIIASGTRGLVATGVIQHGENGLLVPPRDPGAMRQAIDDLWANPEKARRMGLLGRKLVEERFSVDHFTDRIADIISRES